MNTQQMMTRHDDSTTAEQPYKYEKPTISTTPPMTRGRTRNVRMRGCGCQLHWPRIFTYMSWRYRQWRWLHQSEFVWCFRSANTSEEEEEEEENSTGAMVDPSSHHQHNHGGGWKPFESKNQVILWQAYYNQPYPHQQAYFECHVHDKSIDDGKQLVRIILNEHIAFTMDPDWSQPLVYKIAVCRVMRRSLSAKTLWKELVLREKQTGPMYQ
ncbi:hypothetical protein BDA99DRAFT_50558 [Phascolomyces articulosus]|uniref:Uncharacterized protein n=1 Tax=Phascolomyces articulosus TaxID=60185 RepID=A0AAD5PEJ9_9FUNG|nr:hypothetical protein BDA99DRAFT_50558 [Phascolomyces articulosus]